MLRPKEASHDAQHDQGADDLTGPHMEVECIVLGNATAKAATNVQRKIRTNGPQTYT